jgi:hypothetical protein
LNICWKWCEKPLTYTFTVFHPSGSINNWCLSYRQNDLSYLQ